MQQNLKLFFSILLIATISGCATTQVEINRDAFKASPVNSISYQNSAEVISITPSMAGSSGGAAAGGFIGALVGGTIDAGINSSRRKALAPILANVADFNNNDYVINALKEKVTGIAFA